MRGWAVWGGRWSRSRRHLSGKVTFDAWRREPVPPDRGEDLEAGQHAAAQRAGDLAAADPGAIADRQLEHAETREMGAQLHLDRPAVVAIAHAECLQCFAAHDAE